MKPEPNSTGVVYPMARTEVFPQSLARKAGRLCPERARARLDARRAEDSAVLPPAPIGELIPLFAKDCRALGTAFAVMLVLFVMPVIVNAQFNYITNDGALKVLYYIGPDENVTVTIPSTINGLPVASLGDGAFRYRSVASVIIPSSVTNIGSGTFQGCYNLTGISIPDGVTSIGDSAFDSCTGLTNVKLPSNTKRIGEWLFQNCGSLTNITIPEGVTTIGATAFQNCGGLRNITIPASVTSIGGAAFQLSGLTSITIPDTVNELGGGAFNGCSSLTSVTLGKGIIRMEGATFGDCTRLTDVAIPDNVTDIGEDAFGFCTGLTNITIGKSVTNIAARAFETCTSLAGITIPGSVISIDPRAFANCTNLAEISVDPINSTFSSVSGVLFTKDQKVLVAYPSGGARAYTIPSGVTAIGPWAFASCANLSSINMPGSLTSIEQNAFDGCIGLASAAIPSSVTRIASLAFGSCQSLLIVTIPNSVTNIGYEAFIGCTSLTNITVNGLNSNYSSADGILFDKSQSILIECPGGKIGSYDIPDSVVSIEDNAFAGCVGLTGVSIPNGVTNIGIYAFADCASLASVQIPNNVTTIPWASFAGCTSLTNVIVPNHVANIEGYAFSECVALTALYFSGNAPGFGYSAQQTAFNLDFAAIIYHLPGTTGWGATYAGNPTAIWRPQLQSTGPNFGVQTNGFGFNITWANGMTIAVEASTNLSNPSWIAVGTNTLVNGSSYFSDPESTNYPNRFYRLRWP